VGYTVYPGRISLLNSQIFTRKREGKEIPSIEGLDLITKYAE
jgi:hypothetical protein